MKYVVQTKEHGQWQPHSCWKIDRILFREFLGTAPKMMGIALDDFRVLRTQAPWAKPHYEFQPDGTALRVG